MIKQLVERIKKFIKDHIVDDGPCEECGCKCPDCNCEDCECGCIKTIEDIKSPFTPQKKKRGRPRKKK